MTARQIFCVCMPGQGAVRDVCKLLRMPGDWRDTETVKVLCIVYENIDDWDGYDRYRGQVMPTLEPFGGRFLVRGGAFTTIEGEMPFERIAVLEFPSRGAAEDWYQSPAYQAVLPIRLAATRCQFVVVDAVDD